MDEDILDTYMLQHLTFTRNGKGGFDVQINFLYLKGHHGVEGRECVAPCSSSLELYSLHLFRLIVNIRGVTKSQNIHFDLPLILAILALQRGMFVKHTTVDSLLSGTEFELQMKPSKSEEPVFANVKARGTGLAEPITPMMANSLGMLMSGRCNEVGLGK